MTRVVAKLVKLRVSFKGAGQFALALLAALGLGSQTSADTINVGHVVAAAGSQTKSVAVIIERHSDAQVWISNADRVVQRFSPASTSKIPHTLIALERGLAAPETVFQWDGVPRSIPAWNQDQTLETAFQNSAVWVFQQIARTAGREVMSGALTGFGYGNMDVGRADQLATYWLDDTLQISAAEQVAFLSKLARKQLPLSDKTYAAARDIMISRSEGNWAMRSKTGWRHDKSDMDVGWFVGWLECANETYVFALNMDLPDTRYLSKRKAIAYSVLEHIGAFDCDR